ncbi:hypothetical protein PGT21_006188 [Puccinia graminis f. sp. tritici]|uniref:Uncharacterized protein n=1 Tax=Puccinia graminis f. sp. tritici TaxID=56615 RepID=A0A5B0MT73_PUCGR|nr:hypothetical protein PGT21_006188 [Puccinia graminis f. sp. tritici]
MRFSLSHNVSTWKPMTPKWTVRCLLFAAVSHSAEKPYSSTAKVKPSLNHRSLNIIIPPRLPIILDDQLRSSLVSPKPPPQYDPPTIAPLPTWQPTSVIGRPIHFKLLRLGHFFPPPRGESPPPSTREVADRFPPPRESTITDLRSFSTPARIDDNGSPIVFHHLEVKSTITDRRSFSTTLRIDDNGSPIVFHHLEAIPLTLHLSRIDDNGSLIVFHHLEAILLTLHLSRIDDKGSLIVFHHLEAILLTLHLSRIDDNGSLIDLIDFNTSENRRHLSPIVLKGSRNRQHLIDSR